MPTGLHKPGINFQFHRCPNFADRFSENTDHSIRPSITLCNHIIMHESDWLKLEIEQYN